MVTKILPAGNLQSWIDKLVASYGVFAPVEVEGASSFKQIKAGQAPALEIRTDLSPKGIVFKQVEKILSYKKDENGIAIEYAPEEESKKVIFGLRPCDARSFTLTDKPFLDPVMPENKYAERRKQTTLVTMACDKACNTCFCTSVGGAPDEKVGDVWIMNLDGRYIVEALTPAGEELLNSAEGLTDASADDEAAAKKIGETVAASMAKLDMPNAKALDSLFADEAFWQNLSAKCLSCGACTFACPTCYCFDVKDDGTVKSGDRYRGWDSCMFFQYNRAAGGHNPREFHWKRMRQRMLHKFSYFPEKYGDIDCVGCGRCIRSCPVSYDLRDFIKSALQATGGVEVDFEGQLPGEDQVDPLACDVKPSDETVKTGVGSDD